MAVTPKQIIAGQQLAASATTYYTVPTNTKTKVTKFTLTNTTAGAVTATVHLIASGGTASAANTITSAVSLAAGETRELFEVEGHVLPAGSFIQALASAATSITVFASGVEIV